MYWKKIVIYDDILSFAEELKNKLESILTDSEIIAVSNREDAVSSMDGCDLLMLDIELENNNDGIEFFKELKKIQKLDFHIVFVSGYLNNVERVFEVDADGYLIKPVTISRLKLCLQRLSDRKKTNTILVKVKNGILSIKLEKVLYIENNARHIKFYTEDDVIISSSRFSELEGLLPDSFCRCHNSFYVNLNHSASLHRYVFRLDNGKEVPVSQSRYSEAKSKYTSFAGKML